MSVWNDVRLAARLRLRDRAFTLTATFALVLGIAANSLVFTLVNGLLLRDLPFDELNRLMAIARDRPGHRPRRGVRAGPGPAGCLRRCQRPRSRDTRRRAGTARRGSRSSRA